MRAGAQGLLGDQAAVELLIGHEGWLRRDDFVARFVTVDTHPTPTAWVDWQAAIAALDNRQLPCSGGQAGVLRIAASIAEGVPVDLGQALTGLDQTSIHLIAQTVRRVGGHHQMAAWTGQVWS